MSNYNGPERRAVSDDIREYFDDQLREHEKREMAAVKELIDAFSKDAFPSSPSEHRAGHQAQIDASRAEEAFWRDIKVDMAKKSVWAIMQVLLGLIVVGIAAKLGISGVFGR